MATELSSDGDSSTINRLGLTVSDCAQFAEYDELTIASA